MFLQYHGMDISFNFGETFFRVFNIAREQLGRIIPAHNHGTDSYELHYIAEGRGQVLLDGTLYELEPGSLYLVGPHITHAQIPMPSDPQVDECVYFRIERRGRENSSAATLLAGTRCWIGRDTQKMNVLLTRLFDELSSTRVGCTELVRSLLMQLLVSTARDIGDPSSAEKYPFRRTTPDDAQAFIIEEAFLYEYPTLTLEALGQRLMLSARHTERLLDRLYGCNFRQKQTQSRMSAASILLTYTDRPIHCVAEALGYSTSEHFSAAFRKFYGVSAREYRRRYAIAQPDDAFVLTPPEGLSSARVRARE